MGGKITNKKDKYWPVINSCKEVSKPGVYWCFNVSKFLSSKQRHGKSTI